MSNFQGLMMETEGFQGLMMEPEGKPRNSIMKQRIIAVFGLVKIVLRCTLTMNDFQGLMMQLKGSDNGAKSLEAPSSDPESQSWSKYISGQFQQAQICVYRLIRERRRVGRRASNCGRPHVYAAEHKEEILRFFQEDPTTSTNVVARTLGLSQWKVWFIVHTERLYPYHYSAVNVIEEGDHARRLDFCRYMLHADTEDLTILRKILWTNESKFDQDRITN
ncbi:hypothetical protein EVAR_30719_1 [Eumeta japonica]|uniref:Uncharacterized protein n=1 Tax=Eumeta variegata TaxID=151549 RepID=A0A4C1V793_EUMVA|nr:hypothetical protein EVAR_30719_1 [Eumeta japonica]